MKYLKHWKYQCLFGVPFIPWLLIHWIDWIQDTAQSLGYDKIDSGMITGVFALISMIIFSVAYISVHDGYDD